MSVPSPDERLEETLGLLSDYSNTMALPMTGAVPLTMTRRGSLMNEENGFVSDGISSSNDVHDTKQGAEDVRWRASQSDTSDDTQNGAFKTNAALTQFYKPTEKYEGAHRYDPYFQWTEKEENSLRRKVVITLPVFNLTALTNSSSTSESWHGAASHSSHSNWTVATLCRQ